MSHPLSTFVGRAFARRVNRNFCGGSRRNTKHRLRVESLEDRAVPAIFTVTDLGDNGGVDPNPGDGTGTLRQAIVDANATPDDDQIVFDGSLFAGGAQTIDLENTLTIAAAGGGLTITGPAADQLTVQRDPGATTDFRVINSYSANLSLRDFTISGGTAVAAGVASGGTTNLDHMAITGNNSTGIIGGLYVTGGQTVTITNCVISGNSATQAGGIQVGSGATVNLTDSEVSNNTSTGFAGGIVALFGSTVNIVNSTVSGNTSSTGAGGIYIAAGSTLTVQNSTISGNSATAGDAGGIFAGGYNATPTYFGSIVVTDSTITGNSTSGKGGGIYASLYVSVTVTNSTISGNTAGGNGGGIYAFAYAPVTVTDSTISGNTSGAEGGGLYSRYYGSVAVSGSTISNNTAASSGGGLSIRVGSAVTVQDSTISGNTGTVGGGIYMGYNGSLAMYGSTISDNHATTTTAGIGGGGIYFFGYVHTVNPAFPNALIIANSTIANNTSASSGGGISLNTAFGGLAMANTTIVGNSAADTTAGNGGGGISVIPGTLNGNASVAGLQMVNSIVSGNTNINGPDILSSQYVYTLFSAIGSTTGFSDSGGAGDLPVGTDLKLGPLADNGGPTQTMAPQFNADPALTSPLIDAGNNTYGALVGPTDQLGSAHVRIFGSAVDIGSYEVQPPTVTVDQATGQADPTNGSITFDAKFNVPVTGLDASLFDITYGGTLDSSGVTVDLVQDPLDSTHYTLTIGGLTGEGDVTVSLPADAVVDGSQTANVASTSVDNTVRFDDVAPTVTNVSVVTGQADPTNGNISFDVNFSEAMIFDFSEVHFDLGSGLTGTPTGSVTQDPLDPTHYVVTVTGGLTGDGTLTASIPAGATTDLAGNATLVDSGSASVRFDNIAPTATIDQAAGQADPAGGTSVSFDLTFSEPIENPGGGAFDGSTITFTGSTATPSGANFTVQVTPVDSTHYTVTVGGVATGGTIEINLPNGSFQDVAGNLNGTTTIDDNTVDFHATGTLQFSQSAVSVSEQGGADVTFTVTRTGGTDGMLTADYAVTGGTATLGSDYTFTPGTLTFAPGDTSKTFTVHVNDDQLLEGDETADLSINNATYNGSALGGILGSPTTETLTINDFEEGTFDFSSATYTGVEGTDVSVVVNRSSGTNGAASVDLTIAAGTAGAADIGTALGTTTINFADGETSKTVTMHLNADGLSEGDETILLQLSDPTPVNGVGGGAKLGTVTDSAVTIARSDPVVLSATNKFTQKFTDSDKDIVTVKLTGSKTGTVNVYLDNQTPASLQGPISLIDLVGTDSNASLSITVTKAKKTVNPTADGVATIGGVSAPALKVLNAGKINLDGAFGPGVNVAGFLGSLTLGNVLNGADISAGAGTKPTKVTLGAVGDLSNVTIDNPISTFTATSFGNGTITAHSATSITVKGNARAVPANPGDFGADLNLNGAGVAFGKPTLNTLKVAGSLLATSTVDVTGKLGTVTVGTAKKGNTFAGALTADSVTSITVNGNLTGDITVTGNGVAAGKAALGRLSVRGVTVKGVGVVGGTVDGATIHVGDATHIGNVTSFTAVNFLNSEFFAGYAGAPDGSGSFNVSGASGGTVGTFTVADTYANSNAVAALFKKVSIKNVTTVNPTTFGLFAHAFTSIKITTPAIKAASNTPVDQFFVKVV